MPITIGMGNHRYEYQPDWARLPEGMGFQSPSAVAVDSHDTVETLHERIKVVERELYPSTIQAVIDGRIPLPVPA